MSANLLPTPRLLSRMSRHLWPRNHHIFHPRTPLPSASLSTPAPPLWTLPNSSPLRYLHTSPRILHASKPPSTHDRGPKSTEDTQTDFGALDVLRNTAAPATSIDACTSDGFALNNQMRISGSGVLLVGGEAFRWRPWVREGGTATWDDAGGVMSGRLKNDKGMWEVEDTAWGVLELVWPKPDLLIIGTGPQVTLISPSVCSYLSNLGIRIDIQDTRNAAAQFNLLATERGVGQVAAALIPLGWKEIR